MRKKKILESNVEGRSVRHAKERGWTSRKMNGLGFRSWPDRLFLPPRGTTRDREAAGYSVASLRHPFWVEFKRPGKEPTPDQARLHRDLRARGEVVHVCDSFESFRKVFDAIHRAA